MRNALFFAFDDNHWNYFLHCYNSIQINYPNHPEIIVYYRGSILNRISWLKDRIDIRLYLKDLSDNMKYRWYHKAVPSEMVYFKYLLWTDSFEEYDNILHLDADTIVQNPLDEIFKKEDFFIVKNNLSFREIRVLPEIKKSEELIQCSNKLTRHGIRYPRYDDMVNAGVFMIPKKYRKTEYLNSLLSITKDFGHLLVYADQSALSLWCLKHGIVISEDYQYNFQTPLFNKLFMSRYSGFLKTNSYLSFNKNILDKIKIIHFSGPIKPDNDKFLSWKLMGRYSGLFQEYYNRY